MALSGSFLDLDGHQALSQALFSGLALRSEGYRGRFAPSPTGPLHLGNLRTALIGWLQARLHQGQWLLRIDDLDTPRNQPGAEASILEDLNWLGLQWDEPLIRQSERRDLYNSLLSSWRRSGELYPCRCSRRMLADISAPHAGLAVYPGTCRDRSVGWGLIDGRLPSWRLRLPEGELGWCEAGDGDESRWYRCDGRRDVGDIVVRRADGFIAYHLATAVDELCLGIHEVVRGHDLQPSTGAQVAVMARLGQAPPAYWHVPLWRDATGRRLSKRELDAGVTGWRQGGGDAAGLIGVLAESLGLVPKGTRLSAEELLGELALGGPGSLRKLLGSEGSILARMERTPSPP